MNSGKKARSDRLFCPWMVRRPSLWSRRHWLWFFLFCGLLCVRACSSASPALGRTCPWVWDRSKNWLCPAYKVWMYSGFCLRKWDETTSMTVTDSSTGVKMLVCVCKCTSNKYKLSTDFCSLLANWYFNRSSSAAVSWPGAALQRAARHRLPPPAPPPAASARSRGLLPGQRGRPP